MTETAYTVRALTTDDLFPICGLIAKLGADAVQTCLNSPTLQKALTDESASPDSVGVAVTAQAAVVILSRLPDCRDDLYRFIGSLTGLDADTIGAMPPAQFLRMAKAILHREDFRDFFTAACELLGLAN